MTIVFIGDIHQQWDSVERGLANLDPLPNAAILLGDIQCDRPLDELASPLLDRGIDVHWIFGNHDNDGGPEMWANLVEPDRNPRTTQGALLSGMRSDPKADVPAELGDMIVEFKERFVAANAEAARLADPTATDAAALGEAESNKTLATE